MPNGFRLAPKRAYFWDEATQAWRKAVTGEAGDYVWDETTQSWIYGTIGAEWLRDQTTNVWGFGPGGQYVRNTTTNTWDKVTTRGGGPFYWVEGTGWVKNSGVGATGSDLLLETGDHLLKETGDAILLES